MRRSRLTVGLAVAAVLTAGAFTATSALGASSPAPATPAVAAAPQIPQGCNYPPQVRPTVTLSGPASVRRGRNFTLTGTLRLNSCGLPNWPVALFASTRPNGPFVLVSVRDTDRRANAGNFSFNRSGIVVPTYYRVVSASGDGLQTATSNTILVSIS